MTEHLEINLQTKEKKRMEEKNGKLQPNEPGEEKMPILVRRNSFPGIRPNCEYL